MRQLWDVMHGDEHSSMPGKKNGEKVPIEKEINAMTMVDWDAMGAIDHENQLNFLGAGLRRERPDVTRERQTCTDRANAKDTCSSLFYFLGPGLE